MGFPRPTSVPDRQRSFAEARELIGVKSLLHSWGEIERFEKITERYSKPEPVNIGAGEEIKIKDLVYLIKELVGFEGEVEWDTSKPDGQPRRKLDTSRAKREFRFEVKTSLRDGLLKTIEWYAEQGISGG